LAVKYTEWLSGRYKNFYIPEKIQNWNFWFAKKTIWQLCVTPVGHTLLMPHSANPNAPHFAKFLPLCFLLYTPSVRLVLRFGVDIQNVEGINAKNTEIAELI
jgi:hypothetical protein